MARLGARSVRWALGGVAVVVVLGVGGPFVFIHFIEGPAPAKLALPVSKASPGTTATKSSPSTVASVDGTWAVGPGSTVGYRVKEVLIGQQATAVGRTTKVWGSLTVADGSVSAGAFTADMATVVSDQSQRNAQFDGRIMDVSAYPTATFELTSPIKLGALTQGGVAKQYPAAGELTMHGVTRPVSFTVAAERSAASVYVLADIHVVFARWGISNPSVAGFVTTQGSGTLEVLLDLTKGHGNPVVHLKAEPGGATSGGGPGAPGHGPPGGQPSGGGSGRGGSPGPGGPGGGGPGAGGPGGGVTVPKTTVPPLTVPVG
jgi:polyisoprenoid-binding protein YceI